LSETSHRKISRRTFLRASALAGAAALAGSLGYRQYYFHVRRDIHPERATDYLDTVQVSAQPESLPNIILIVTDDLGYGDLKSDVLKRPNLDRMAAEGVEMTDFYATASVCTPSRAGLLTGRYPVRTLMTLPLAPTGDPMNIVFHLLGFYAYGVTGIPEDEILVSEALSRRGYRTALVGKWHLGDRPGHIPSDRGFDLFYGALYANDSQPYAIYRNRDIEIPAPADQNMLTQEFTREALAFIEANKDQPFFLYLAHAMPHEPIHASDAFRGRSAGGLYGDAVEELDWSVGQVLDAVDQLGLADKTLVMFTSDNGPWWQGDPGFTRGRKRLNFEGGFRVPFLARWPGTIPPGTVSHEMVMNFDLFPLCLGLAGVPLPRDRIIDGKDIMLVLRGESPSPHDTLLFYDVHSLAAVRRRQYKYYRRAISENGSFWPLKQGPFLFDLESDPDEAYSLIESKPDLAAEMAALLRASDSDMRANVRGWL
jgi:arylsulfatase A